MNKAQFKTKSSAIQSRILLLTLGISIVLLVAHSWHIDGPDVIIDDAYISFRYSSNAANGLGLVYNLNEHVEGYTNFLWTVLLAGIVYLGLDIVIWSKILSLCAAIGTLIVIYLFSQHLFSDHKENWLIVSLPLILFSVMTSQARHAVSGMETLLFVFLVTLSTYLFYQRRWVASSVVFSL